MPNSVMWMSGDSYKGVWAACEPVEGTSAGLCACVLRGYGARAGPVCRMGTVKGRGMLCLAAGDCGDTPTGARAGRSLMWSWTCGALTSFCGSRGSIGHCTEDMQAKPLVQVSPGTALPSAYLARQEAGAPVAWGAEAGQGGGRTAISGKELVGVTTVNARPGKNGRGGTLCSTCA